MHVSWTVAVESIWVFGLWVCCQGALEMKGWFCVLSFFCAMFLKLRRSDFATSSPCVSSFCTVLMTRALNVFLVSTGVPHQRHLLWQHLSHHLQKIQQILWPAGNHPPITNRFPLFTLCRWGFHWTPLLVSLPCIQNPRATTIVCTDESASLVTFPCTRACIPLLDTFMNQCVG